MSFCEEWTEEIGEESDDLDARRPYNRLPLILGRQQVDELLNDGTIPKSVRLGWRALYSGGLRPQELEELSDWRGNVAQVARGPVLFDAETSERLREVAVPPLAELSGWLQQKLGAFYTSLGRRPTLRCFRHAAAVHCLENGMDTISLYYLLGLEDYKVAGIYRRAAVGLHREEFAAAHPLMAGGSKRLHRSEPAHADEEEEPEQNEEEPEAEHIYARLTLEELKLLQEAILNPKHRLVVRLLYATGLRRAELVNLTFDDFCLPEGRLFVRAGKGGKDRYCLIDPETARQVLAEKVRAPKSEIFELGVHMVYDILAQAGARSGLQQKFAAQGLTLSPHSLRNTFATHCYLGGMAARSISALLGHSKMSTLLDYLECSPETRQRAYDSSRD